MARTARPSDVYRLPEHAAPPPEDPERPQRRLPLWVAVAGLLAGALVVSGLARGTATTTTGEVPLVDIVSEDQAIAALTLYGAQASTIAELRSRADDIFAPPGPRDAVRVAEEGLAATQQALNAARALGGADPLAAAYWNAGEHVAVINGLETVRHEADLINLLSSTHDTLYSGVGAIPLPEARNLITGAFTGRQEPSPLTLWAEALVGQMEDRNRVQEASAQREASKLFWKARVSHVQPAGVDLLRGYLNGLPAATLDGVRGHPVAGPALELLEQEQRVVSSAR